MNSAVLSEQKFRNKITLLSFVCSMFVIWIHTSNLDVYGIDADSKAVAQITYCIEQLLGQVVVFATPMFFFISGFLFFRNFELKKVLDKYKSRIRSILIPYLVWNTLYYLFFAIMTNVPGLKRFVNAVTYSLSIEAWLRALWVDEYYTLWFLKNLIIFIVISPILYVLLKNWHYLPSGLIMLMLMLNLGYFIPEDYLLNGFGVFAAGSYLAINHKDKALYCNKWISVAGILTIVLLFITKQRYLNSVTQVILFIGIWYALDLININGYREMPYYMRITFFTYVAHDLILETLEKVWLVLFGTDPVYALIDYVCMPFVTLFILVFISVVLRRFVPKVWNVLNGCR